MPVCSVHPSWMNGSRVLGDRALGVGRRRVGEHERLAVALDEHVDLVEVHAVRELGREARRCAASRGVGLDDEQPVGIARRRGAARRSVAPACSDRLR